MTVYEMRTYTLQVGKMVRRSSSIATQEVKLLTAAPWGPHP
jgi:hypothetical protein